MKRLFGLGALVVACACVQLGVSAQQPTQEQYDKSQQKAPDNTAKNMRDKVGGYMTAGDASNNKADMETARQIRKSIMATKGLSMDAQNVKIITKNGVVILRGPVDNDNEKATIESIVKNSGVQSFTNELEVKGQNSQR